MAQNLIISKDSPKVSVDIKCFKWIDRLINIEQVCKAKFLGIIIDEQLNWKEHILYISNKISKAIGVIVKARSLGKRALLSLYYSMIYPYLTYCCQIWGVSK